MASKRENDSEKAMRLTKALAHDLRLRILRLAMNRSEPLSPREASEELSVVLSNVAYHFRILAGVQALELKRREPVRGSIQHFYAPNPVVVEMPMVREILAATAS